MQLFVKKPIRYYVDKAEYVDSTLLLSGWALSTEGASLRFTVLDANKNQIEITRKILDRRDASLQVFGDERAADCGFQIRFSCKKDQIYRLIIAAPNSKITLKLDPAELIKEQEKRYVSWKKALRITTGSMLLSDLHCLLKKGPGALKIQWMKRYETEDNRYMRWLANHEAVAVKPLAQEPCLSVIVPLYQTPKAYFLSMLKSVLNQNYQNWQLCLADGSPGGTLFDAVKPYLNDKRIVYQKLEENLGIAGNTDAALQLAKGEWILLLDHDDLLAKTALYEIAKAIVERQPDVIYTDEDKVTADLKIYREPHFKPDFNLDLLRSNNYICHLFAVKTSIARQAGGFRPGFEGAQDYDFILRCVEQAKAVVHLPRVLYHWRMHPGSTADNPESKMYCYQAGKRAIEDHLARLKVRGEVRLDTRYPGYYHVEYPVENNPLVSILIPNRDEADTLTICLDSIREKTVYQNYEIIIIENNSRRPETFTLYQRLEKEKRAKVAYFKGPFNYSEVNNFGASVAKGDYLVLLNNDTRIINPDWLGEMLGNCQRPEVGITGARLLYPDDTIQHAGVVMGLAGVCGHIFCGLEQWEPGPFARAVVQQNYSAVTAACLMVKKEIYDQVNGLDPSFAVAYNDVDFCLRVRELGYLIVYNPKVLLYHYESKSRGYEDTPEKKRRFEEEKRRLLQRWGRYLEDGDPYYNPNLTKTAPDGSIAYEGG